ncbi:porin [Vreelandella aquamarina]|uniref:porin n=1 Tax=Vreelandella aquamarina TaxID=77097 RepID=UPI00385007FC
MKKTLLATAVVSAIAAMGATSSVQAATVFDQDGTKLDVYGRISMGIRGGGDQYRDPTAAELDGDPTLESVKIDNGAEFVDVYSRLGFNMSQQVTNDLSAFGRLEWRYSGDESSSPGFNEIRQSYVGLQSNQFGTVQAGNFDSFYNQFVSLPFDVYIDRGLEFAGHPTQSRGDSIGYFTPELEGFTVYLQAKHYSERDLNENGPLLNGDGDVESAGVSGEGNVIAAQGGVRYQQGPITVGLGFVEDVVRGGGNGELLGGLIGSYAVNDALSVRLGYEGRGNSDTYVASDGTNGFDKIGLGMSYSLGDLAFNADIYDVDPDGDADSRTSWALGSYYNVSSNFNVFLELQQADQQPVTVDISEGGDAITSDSDDIYYVTGARYFF